MSRSGYSDYDDDYDYNQWAMIRWRGAVASAFRGKKGQAFLKELLAAMDALPEKRLITDDLVTPSGEYCTLGTLGRARGIDMTIIDPEDYETVARIFNVNSKIVQEIEWMNDDSYGSNYTYKRNENGEYERVPFTPEDRFNAMRKWIVSKIND